MAFDRTPVTSEKVGSVQSASKGTTGRGFQRDSCWDSGKGVFFVVWGSGEDCVRPGPGDGRSVAEEKSKELEGAAHKHQGFG